MKNRQKFFPGEQGVSYMCQNGSAMFAQLLEGLGVSGRFRPTNEAEAEALAAKVIKTWGKDPRWIRSAYGSLSGSTNEARRLASLPQSSHHQLATVMVTKMDEFATDELRHSRQFAEIIQQLNASLNHRRQAATA